MESQRRTFTRAEAEALLPEVDRLLGEVQRLADTLAGSEGETQPNRWKPRANGRVHPVPRGEAPPSARGAVARQVQHVLDQLHGMGIVVRDIRSGLIDFPSLREGRVVNLCWRRGEPLTIRWWHEVGAGFGGRQPI